MRRLMVVVALLALVAIGWFVLSRDSESVSSGGGGHETAPAAHTPDEVKTPRKRTEEEIRAEEKATALAAAWAEIGQDRAQDPKLGAIKGRVMRSKGFPAAEGVVETSFRGQVSARAKIGKEGEFLLKNAPPAQALSLAAKAPEFAPGGVDRILVGAGETFDTGDVFLGAAMDPDTTNRVEVLVVDAEGKNVPGARVTATSTLYGALIALGSFEKQPGGTVVRQSTDANGVAVFEKLPPASYDVFAEADGLAFEVEQRYLVQRDTKTTITLEMDAGQTIEGIVTDKDGKPVAKAHIGAFRLQNFTMNPAIFTGDDGKFVVPGLAGGTYMLFAFKEGVGEKEQTNVAAGAKDVAVQLDPGAEMFLKVTDAATGAPIKSFAVRPFRNEPFVYLFSPLVDVTTDDGTWKHGVPPKSYGVEVTAKGYAQKSIPSVPLGKPEPTEVKLDPARVLHGRVVSKGSNSPVRAAKVYVKRGGFPPSPVKDLQTVTDENGVFVLDGLPATAIAIWVSHVDHTDQTFDVTGLPRGEDGSLPAQQEFAIGDGGRIVGHVYGPDHAPLSGESVVISKGAMDFLSMRNTTVAADGAYEFKNVPPATYRVSVGGSFTGNAKNGVAVTEGAIVTLDFGAETGGQKLAGKLVKDDQSPVPDVNVTLDNGSGTTQTKTTDKDGRFAFENVAPGKVSLRSWGRTKTVDVIVKAEEPPAEVVLVVVSGSIEGKVIDAETGQPITGAWLDCEQVADASGKQSEVKTRSFRGNGMNRADGTFRFGGLDEGTYRIRSQHDPYGSEIEDGIVIGPGEKKTGVEIKMTTGAGTLAGSARTAAGAPIEGASIQIKDPQGRLVFSISLVNTSSDGTFTQGQLKPGEYDVSLEKEGFAPSTKHVTIESKKETHADFKLLQGGRIEVSARLADGAAAPRVTTMLFDTQGHVVEKGLTLANIFNSGQPKTDEHGQITLRGVAPGAYVVRLRQDDGTEATGNVEVVEDASTAVEIRFAAR